MPTCSCRNRFDPLNPYTWFALICLLIFAWIISVSRRAVSSLVRRWQQ